VLRLSPRSAGLPFPDSLRFLRPLGTEVISAQDWDWALPPQDVGILFVMVVQSFEIHSSDCTAHRFGYLLVCLWFCYVLSEKVAEAACGGDSVFIFNEHDRVETWGVLDYMLFRLVAAVLGHS
jgi:hypothetical protein